MDGWTDGWTDAPQLLRVQRHASSCTGGNGNGFSCSPLEGVLGSDLLPGLLPLLASECGREVWGLAVGQVVPNSFFTGLFPVASVSTIRLRMSILGTWVCGLLQGASPSTPQNPSSTWGFGSCF